MPNNFEFRVRLFGILPKGNLVHLYIVIELEFEN